MNLKEITKAANNYTDETFGTSVTVDFFNECIAKINASIHCSLSFIDSNNTTYDTNDYTDLSETWLRLVVVPYVAYSIKANDSSTNEASLLLNKFENGLRELKTNKMTAIPEEARNNNFSGTTINRTVRF